jgi:hypothetical protein
MEVLIKAFIERARKAERGEAVAEYPSELAAYVLSALDARFAVVELPEATDVRTTPRGARCATFGEIDATVTAGTWWMDHRTTGVTLHDTDPHSTGGDYVAALRWVKAQLAEQFDRCDPERGYHSTPHRGCILR